MREIKFRAWNESICEMVDLHKITPLALSDTMNTQLAIQNMDGLFIPFSSQFDLMQYTGLKDKNGKEIYEGDIVRGKHGWQETVLLDNYGLMLYLKEISNNLKVIGNIWENPELKEGK